MSWLEVARVGALAKSFKLAAAAGLVAGIAALGGCGWQPLYGPTASGAALADVMRTVDIATVPGRVGQQVRNELIFRTTGGGARTDHPEYRLEMAIKESLFNTLVDNTGDPKSQIYQVYTEYKLIRLSDKKAVVEGHTSGRASFDKVDSIFADIRAKRDAEDRAARTVAEAIRNRIAAYLSTNA